MFDAGPHSLLMGSYPNCPLPWHFRSSQMGVTYPRRSAGEGPKSRAEIILLVLVIFYRHGGRRARQFSLFFSAQ